MARAAPFRTFVNAAALIAIDWGTTRARAYRMDRNGRVLGERTEDENEATLDAVGPNATQLGFYSYGELSPLTDGTCDLHNQTMTITTISEA